MGVGLCIGVGAGARRVGHNYDRVVNGASGNDGNPGTAAQPWATTTPLVTAIEALGAGKRLTALIKASTYNENSLMTFTNGAAARAYAKVYAEAGTVFQGPQGISHAGWLNNGGNNAWALELIGLGPIKGANQPLVTGYDTGGGNGLGMSGGGSGPTFIVRNFHVNDCVDGWTMHFTSTMDIYDCVIEGCNKAAVAHVHAGGRGRAFRCDFTGLTGATSGILVDTSSGDPTEYHECTFTPATAGQNASLGDSVLEDCTFGTLTTRLTIIQTNGAALDSCFLNVFADGIQTFSMNECYGKLTGRHRNGGAITDTNCIWKAGASGSVDARYTLDFDPGVNGGPHTSKNTIITGYGTNSIGSSATATTAAQFIDGGARVTFCCLFGNVAPQFDADIAADDSFAIFAHDNITADPLVGPCNTTVKADWGYLPGSPCIGAGEGGANIGFAA